MSATLPARIREDVLSKLQFGRDYLNVDEGNDQPNVSIIVRGIQHPLNTYADLDFVIGVLGNTDPKEIRKNFIYADNIATGVEIIDHLISLLPPEYYSGKRWESSQPGKRGAKQRTGKRARAR
jgi:hypothetical protein